jgi:hypothetical protein
MWTGRAGQARKAMCESISKTQTNFKSGLNWLFPLEITYSTFHKCMESQKKIILSALLQIETPEPHPPAVFSST